MDTLKTLKKIGLFILCVILIKLFAFDLYYVPSDSMKSTIKPKSYVLISKLHYGAKLPRSTHEIPYLSKLFKKINPINLWQNSRLFGFQNINKEAIVLAENQWFKIIKRVVAVAGDTITITNGFLNINSKKEPLKNSYKLTYNTTLNKEDLSSLKNKMTFTFKGNNNFEVITKGTNFKYLKDKNIQAYKNPNEQKIYPQSMDSLWDRNNYGPLIVPFDGMKIKLTKYNYTIYKEILELYEEVIIQQNNNNYLINGKNAYNYEFKHNYYFLMGDNRMTSIDSRFFGFVPEHLILGKLVYCL